MLARPKSFSPPGGSKARSLSKDGEGLGPSIVTLEPRRDRPRRWPVPPLAGRAAGELIRGSGTFLSLVHICLSELRTDIERLLGSGWAEPERNRTCELATVIHQACEQQGLRQLAAVMRSIAILAGLSREDATPLYTELRKQFKTLLLLAEKGLLNLHRIPARA